jgi:hypothetical protein
MKAICFKILYSINMKSIDTRNSMDDNLKLTKHNFRVS